MTSKRADSCKCKSYDAFGIDIAPFRFQGTDKFNTKYGLAVTAFLSLVFIVMVSFNTAKYLKVDENPINQKMEYRKGFLNGNLNSNERNLKWGFLFTDLQRQKYLTFEELSTYFNIVATKLHLVYERDDSGQLRYTAETVVTPMKVVQCRDASYNERIQSLLSNLTVDQIKLINDFSLCIEHDDVVLSQDFGKSFDSIDFKVYPCTGSKCTNTISPDMIKISTIVVFPELDLQNRYEPLRMTVDYMKEDTLKSNIHREVKLMVKQIKINTESGRFIQDSWDFNALGFETFHNNDIQINPVKPCYYSMTAYPSNLSLEVSRTYETFIDFLSGIGGIGEIIGWLGILIYSWYNSYFFDK